MRKLMSCLLLSMFICNYSFADCDFSKGVNPNSNHTFIYSNECHLAVGKLVETNNGKDKEIVDLKKAIDLKDLALTKADQRTQNWINTSDALTDRMNKITQETKQNEWIYFGLGVLTTFVAAYAAVHLAH